MATGCAVGPAADAKAKPSKAPEIDTDTEPLATRLPKLGRIVSAHWQQKAPGADSRVPGPTDHHVSALMKLAPGSVAALTASTQMQPAAVGTEPESISIPTELTEFVPAGAQWVHSRVLDESLVRADSAELYFDPTSGHRLPLGHQRAPAERRHGPRRPGRQPGNHHAHAAGTYAMNDLQSQATSRARTSATSMVGQALAIFLPGIGSASAVRHSGAPKASAKYCVSCTTCPWANSIMLTE